MAKVNKKPMAKAAKRRNPHMGSSFDDFLKEEGIFEEVQAEALKRALADPAQGAGHLGRWLKAK